MDQQEIYLEPNQDGSSFALTNSHVQIHTCRTYETARDSGNVKSNALVDYRWEVKVYHGNLVAVHKDGDALAYILHGRSGCAVRVYQRSTKQRALIKGFNGQVVDMCWSFTTHPLFIAFVDDYGHLFVYRVQLDPTEVLVQKYFHLIRHSPLVPPPKEAYRVVWCPYVADEDSNSSSGLLSAADCGGQTADNGQLRSCGLLAVAYNDNVDVIDLDPLIDKHGYEVNVESGPLVQGFATFCSRGTIQHLTLSPDATALAVATQSGEVIFYIMESLKEIREAHHWQPHKGRPVSTILFLDDVTDNGKDVHFWKYALTASDENREMKLWNCETWECFSTLRIEAPNAHMEHTALILTLDWSANYLFLSDIERKSLYIVQVAQSHGIAKFISFSEFPLVQPALSLAIVEASRKRFRPFSPALEGCVDLDRSDEDDGNKVTGVRVSLYAVNPKSLLELEIRYQPTLPDEIDSHLSSTSSMKMDSYRDELSDLSADVMVEPPPASELAKVLMSSENFKNNNAKKLHRIGSSTDSATPVERTPTKDIDNDRVSNSPSSQEVRTILSHSSREEESYSAAVSSSVMDNVERPPTPVSHTLDIPTPSLTEAWRKSVSGTKLNESVAPPPNANLLYDAITKLNMEVERVVAHMQRQEDELHQLKTALNGQGDMFQRAMSNIQTSEQQIKNSEDALHQCQLHVQSFRSDQFKQAIIQTVQDAVQRNLDTIVKSEMRNVNATVNESMTKIKGDVQSELSQKLTTTDALLRDNIGKMVKSKPVIDAIGQSAGQAIANDAHAAYKQAFQTVVVPSFESASRNLFTQMNDIFRKGTTEYLEQLQRQITVARASNDELKNSVMTHLTAMTNEMKSSFDKQAAAFGAQMQTIVDKQMQQSTSKMHDALTQSVRSIVKDELTRLLADNQQQLNDTVMRVLRSQAATPAPSSPHVDRQQLQKELTTLLQQNNFMAAFQQALSATDLGLLMFVCAKVAPTQIFSATPCPLSPPLVLSLIQQLSTDLTNQTELKLKYLSEAITSIDTRAASLVANASAHNNMTRVIGQLQQSLNAFLKTPQSAPYQNAIKLLNLAAQSMLN